LLVQTHQSGASPRLPGAERQDPDTGLPLPLLIDRRAEDVYPPARYAAFKSIRLRIRNEKGQGLTVHWQLGSVLRFCWPMCLNCLPILGVIGCRNAVFSRTAKPNCRHIECQDSANLPLVRQRSTSTCARSAIVLISHELSADVEFQYELACVLYPLRIGVAMRSVNLYELWLYTVLQRSRIRNSFDTWTSSAGATVCRLNRRKTCRLSRSRGLISPCS